MIANRELRLEDYVAMCRRRLGVILVPVLIAPIVGFLISYAFPPNYTSTSLIMVEGQTVPSGYVKPIITAAVSTRMTTLQQQVLSRNRLQPAVERLGLTRRKGKSVDEVIDNIRRGVSIRRSGPSGGPGQGGNNVPGFYVSFTTDNPGDAQQICGEITSMLLEENLKAREQVAANTTDFLSQQLDEAKRKLDERDNQLATFKNQHLGQLPSDIDNNLKILTTLDSQLDAITQMLNRAQQDKTYTESVLAQQLAGWKSSQTTLTAETIRQRVATLQTQLVALRVRYTEDHPEVIKVRQDIADLKAKLKEVDASKMQNVNVADKEASTPDIQDASNDTKETGLIQAQHNNDAENARGKSEPPEILQLRFQIHQNENAIARGTHEQKQLQAEIAKYQSRLALSPQVEEEYKQLTRDNETAQQLYNSLLINKSESEMQTDMEHRQQGEQMRLLDPASLPEAPSFPVRWQFASGGLAAGFALGASIAMLLEFRDKAIRNEADVLAGLGLPMLTSIPWVGTVADDVGKGFRGWLKSLLGQKKTVEVSSLHV